MFPRLGGLMDRFHESRLAHCILGENTSLEDIARYHDGQLCLLSLFSSAER